MFYIITVIETTLFGGVLKGSVIFNAGVCSMLHMYVNLLHHIVHVCVYTVSGLVLTVLDYLVLSAQCVSSIQQII